MRRHASLAGCLALVLGAAPAGCTRSGEPERVAFFYQEVCPSCEDYQRAERIAGRVFTLGRRSRAITAEAHNLLDQPSLDRLEEVLRQAGLPDISRSVPLLVVNDRYIVGYEEMGYDGILWMRR